MFLLIRFYRELTYYVIVRTSKKLNIDPVLIAQKVCTEIYDKVKTSRLDELASEI